MTRPPLTFQGVQFDLGHLAPTQMLCPRIGTAGPDLVIDVRFSHHAYTVAAPDTPDTAGTPHVSERGDVRLFDLVRRQRRPWLLVRCCLSSRRAVLRFAQHQVHGRQHEARPHSLDLLPA